MDGRSTKGIRKPILTDSGFTICFRGRAKGGQPELCAVTKGDAPKVTRTHTKPLARDPRQGLFAGTMAVVPEGLSSEALQQLDGVVGVGFQQLPGLFRVVGDGVDV